jgi:hypothetical protein
MVVTPADVTARAGRPGSGALSGPLLTRLLVDSPDLVVSALAGFSLGPMILLLSGHFSRVPVIVLGLVGAVVAVRIRGVAPGPGDRSAAGWTGGAIALVIAWFAANVGFSAQNVYATRDPATYDITARWLMDHATLHIATNPALFGAGFDSCNGNVGRLCNGSAGFSPVSSTELYSQGNHLMPALAAVGGWLFGVDGLFKTNVVLGGLALLALFGLARRVVGGPWALVATAAIAVSMPMIYVSRDTYSEPLMMLFLMGALGLLHHALGTRRVRDFALAGVVAGCSTMVRIDSYGALLAIIVAAGAVAGFGAAARRRSACAGAAALLVGAAVPGVIGWLDLTWLSYGYYRDQRSNIVLEVKAVAAVFVLTLLVVALLWRPGVRRVLAAEATRRRLATAAGAAVVLVFAYLLSRPLWMTGHQRMNNPTLAAWQRQSHVAVDGTRTYAEQTVNWLGEYYGWPTVALGVAGYVLLIHRLVRAKEFVLVGLLFMGLSMSALYLSNPQITPDQPWAMRRYVPVILPILLIAAAAALRALYERRQRWAQVVAVLGAVCAVAFPLAVAARLWNVREEYGQYAQVQAICAAVGKDGAVVEVDAYSLAAYGQTMRSYCNVPSIGLVGATPAQLAAMNAAVSAHHRRLFVMSRDSGKVPFAAGGSTTPFSTVITKAWPHFVGGPPTLPGGLATPIYLGTVGADGRVSSVKP